MCDWFLDNKLLIHFGEDKTKTILSNPKNLKKRAEPLLVKRNDVTLKQFSSVEYLGCLLDSVLSGEDMALKVLTKVNGIWILIQTRQIPEQKIKTHALQYNHSTSF